MKEVHMKFEWCLQGRRWGWEKEALRLLVNLGLFLPSNEGAYRHTKSLPRGAGAQTRHIGHSGWEKSGHWRKLQLWKSTFNKCCRHLTIHTREQVNCRKAITYTNLLFASEIKCHMSALEQIHLPNFWIWIINQTLKCKKLRLTDGKYQNVQLGQWVKSLKKE